jgi:hypothetical protein
LFARRYELPDEELKGRLELKIFDNIGKGVSTATRAVAAASCCPLFLLLFGFFCLSWLGLHTKAITQI